MYECFPNTLPFLKVSTLISFLDNQNNLLVGFLTPSIPRFKQLLVYPLSTHIIDLLKSFQIFAAFKVNLNLCNLIGI